MRISLAFKCFADSGSVRIRFLGNSCYEQARKMALKVIPVLDVLNGVAVHAVRGIRKEYKPLRSVLCDSTNPVDVAQAFERLGFSELYVADLDAITANNRSSLAVKQIGKSSSIRLTVDGGISDIGSAEEIMQIGVSKVVIGTETLSNIASVQEAIQSFGADRVMLSLDLREGRLLSKLNSEVQHDPLSLLRLLCDMGVSQIIVLDLAKVGSREGVDTSFLKPFLRNFRLKVFVGGGVRDCADLLELEAIGIEGALLATALHSGAIGVKDLVNAGIEL